MRTAAIITAFVLASTATAKAQGQQALVAAGEIVSTNVDDPRLGPDWGEAIGLVDASPEQVLTVIQDYGHYAGFLPHFSKSRILAQRGNNAIVYLEAEILKGTMTLWGQIKMYRRRPKGETRIVEAKMMKGKGNMAHLVARWEVTPVEQGKRTEVRLRLLVDPDLPVPDSLVSAENKKAARRAIRALRRRTKALAVRPGGPTSA